MVGHAALSEVQVANVAQDVVNQALQTPTGAGSTDSSVRNQQILLRDLGAQVPIELRGIDQSVYLPLSMRLDETVQKARLRLNYTFSPGLLADLSQIKVSINDEVLGTVPAVKGKLGSPQSADIELDPRYFTEYAKLRLQFIGHYTTDCEYPFHTSLWAQVSNQSVLELTTRRLPLRNDLSLLPTPFFDVRDAARLRLPFVMASQPPLDVVRSAGVPSSWFGALASYRGADFPVSSKVPAGHTIVLATNEHRPTGVEIPTVEQPTLKLIDHPSDPGAKVLLVLGRDGAQLSQAVDALVLGQAALSGEQASVGKVELPARLAAHDAPNIVKTGTVVKLGQLVGNSQALQVTGTTLPVIRLPLRLPADTFAWRTEGVPIELRYRYTPPAQLGTARLAVQINDQLVESFLLRPAAAQSTQSQRMLLPFLEIGGTFDRQDLVVPAFQLGSTNELQFRFEIPPVESSRCRDTVLVSQASVDADSTIDLRNLEHYATLPNLAMYANSGFPFTKFADLAETAVVMSDQPGPEEIETALGVLGQMGAATGVAGTRLQVVGASQVKSVADRDLLVIATGPSPAPLDGWSQSLPTHLDAAARGNSPLTRFSDTASEWFTGATPRRYPGKAWTEWKSEGPLAALMGFESPLSAGRSVVALQATDPATLGAMRVALLDPAKVARMQGDLVLVRGSQLESFRVGDVYQVGELRWWRWVWYQMRGHPLLLVLLVAVISLLLALTLYRALRARAERRVQGES
ncbi:cellulose biosynthesis cyclic di-GMP-binding regulatory protein BcsB [Leptothrix discophora]|uniref:Cyclic di-GMP-binding protein n=1 Tax=Leptothrix discophora TaxID=89 RepID=A0ABT9G1A2_LEPDI|nr:cellulose biosynthesis cyclic di-GMP-binding regulatory protein BcsB [Leptothrix discophora]MDP4300237.1 cellulose biosynthesis cyclic di-GMP-binding regulatory protein BcsB [Leptothrix discophora]